MSAARTAVEDAFASPSQCWCCGKTNEAEVMVRLGNHPEVVLCRGCVRWAAKRAWEIDDRSKTGLPVNARARLRRVRRAVMDRGWHRSHILGAPLRWLGNRLP